MIVLTRGQFIKKKKETTFLKIYGYRFENQYISIVCVCLIWLGSHLDWLDFFLGRFTINYF